MRRHACLVSSLLAATLLASGCQSVAATDGTPAQSVTSSSRSASDNSRQATPPSEARQDFATWVREFRRTASQQGIDDTTLVAAFDPVRYQPRIIELDRSQPEFTRQVWDYLDTAVSPARVTQGQARLAEHRRVIEAASEHYGVPAEVLVAIWGIESNYGSNFGSFSTIDALATLGYDGRRPDFARSELMSALRILQRGDIDRDHMRGSWAGAMGHTQFLPSSFEAYARDADGDGRRDIWGSIADVMASTANYLAQAGWQPGEPWGREVRLPQGFDYSQTELDTRRTSQAWAEMGVQPVRGDTLPDLASASVIAPAGAQGPAFIVGDNFRTIMRYNASTSYALAVALLSERLAGEPGLAADWPRHEQALSHAQIRQLQQALNAKGFEVGKPDGLIGPNTRRGLRAYQRSLGMVPDGFATLSLLQRLTGEE